MKLIAPVLIICYLLIAGCSDDKQSYAEMSDDNVFKGQTDALEKAKSVESTIQSNFDQKMQGQ